MKRLLFLLIPFVWISASAQMDERFYFPSKNTEKLDSLQAETFVHVFEGDSVYSYLLKPTGAAKATVLYCHGAGGNVGGYLRYVQPLVKDGYQVYMIDFRGYGHSTGKPTHLNIAADGQKLFDHALGLEAVKNTKIIVCGVSMGTQIAAHLAANNESKITALVLDGTIASFTEIAAAYSPEAQKKLIRQVMISPYSAMEDVGRLQHIPVLFIHSKEDREVPMAQYEMVEARCKTKHSLFLYTGGHVQAPVVATADYLKHFNALLAAK